MWRDSAAAMSRITVFPFSPIQSGNSLRSPEPLFPAAFLNLVCRLFKIRFFKAALTEKNYQRDLPAKWDLLTGCRRCFKFIVTAQAIKHAFTDANMRKTPTTECSNITHHPPPALLSYMIVTCELLISVRFQVSVKLSGPSVLHVTAVCVCCRLIQQSESAFPTYGMVNFFCLLANCCN